MAAKIKLSIDVVRLYNSSESNPATRRAVAPTLTNEFFRREFGRRVIDEIRKRTEKERIDKNNSSLTKYSKSYEESLAGQVYGKKASQYANLTASGQMLANMEVVGTPARSVVIAFPSQDQNDKAHGHVYGGGFRSALPVRDFFGLPEKEQQKILKDTLKDFNKDAELFFDIPPADVQITLEDENGN